MEKSRKIYIDIIKIVAILLVIFNHTGESGFLAYQKQGNIYIQIIEMCITSFCKIAVPLYFMCSGALLLGKNEDIKELLRKRVLKYIIIIIIFTVLYYIILSFRDGGEIDINWILRTIYTSTTFSFSGAYWFLYAYISFLIMLPLLKIIAQNITGEVLKYILGIYAVFGGILPIFEKFMGLGGIAISIPIVSYQTIFYPLLGYCIDQNLIIENETKEQKIIGLMALISIISSVSLTLISFKHGEVSETYYTLLGGFVTIFTFFMMKKICEKRQYKFGKRKKETIRWISNCTFGIFLLHGYAFMTINEVLNQNRYYEAWIKVICVFVMSLLATSVLKKIPVINRFI
ncbi:acyltransferase [Dorea sp. AF36-15AT]|uniref:acyltransferase n=1 Tax=Dorea sp. AF36-15AT TaxID=2292041 RepID=UPI000E545EF7|nr:acyltransferase [Dorea sp. AF36-15AT]RHP10541.1 acyltransferase [Dorea sp. AF36-15AT]